MKDGAVPMRYHHGDLRAALVAAAERLLAEQGGWTFTLREVARAAGVSHNAPYNHFADKRALLDTIATRAFCDLQAALALAVAKVPGANAAATIEVAAIAYVLFAVDQPGRFRLMFSAELAQAPSPGLEAATAATFGALSALIHAGVAAGELYPDRHETHALAAWSLVHGLSSLILDGRAAQDLDRSATAELARTVGQTLLGGLTR